MSKNLDKIPGESMEDYYDRVLGENIYTNLFRVLDAGSEKLGYRTGNYGYVDYLETLYQVFCSAHTKENLQNMINSLKSKRKELEELVPELKDDVAKLYVYLEETEKNLSK